MRPPGRFPLGRRPDDRFGCPGRAAGFAAAGGSAGAGSRSAGAVSGSVGAASTSRSGAGGANAEVDRGRNNMTPATTESPTKSATATVVPSWLPMASTSNCVTAAGARLRRETRSTPRPVTTIPMPKRPRSKVAAQAVIGETGGSRTIPTANQPVIDEHAETLEEHDGARQDQRRRRLRPATGGSLLDRGGGRHGREPTRRWPHDYRAQDCSALHTANGFSRLDPCDNIVKPFTHRLI